jgi:site-specific DNA recombinase
VCLTAPTSGTRGEHRRGGESSNSLLTGLLFDRDGTRFTPPHTIKGGRRYRYYVERALITGEGTSRAKVRRIPAHEIEGLVSDAVVDFLGKPDRLLDVLGDAASATAADGGIRQGRHLHQQLVTATLDARSEFLRPMLRRVVIGNGEIGIAISRDSLRTTLGLPHVDAAGDTHEIAVPTRVTTNGVGLKLVVGNSASQNRSPNPELVKVIARAHDWWQRLLSGEADSIRELAAAEGVSRAYMGRVLRLAFLAPDIVEAILDGAHRSVQRPR